MAAATARRKGKPATTKAAKPAPVVEPEELDEDLETEDTEDEEMDELEEDEVAETKPKSKKAKTTAADAEITFGIRDLVELIKTETGQDTDPRAIRTLIRKMARDESGRVDRTITPGNRTRYNWSGPNDTEVRAIVDAFKGGELEEEKRAKLAALKTQKAEKAAAKKKAAPVEVEEDDADEDEAPAPKKTSKKTAAKRRKAAPVVEEVEDDEDLDFDDE